MELLRSLSLLLGWFSGTLVGITACLFAFGYVITAANLRMLGLTEQVVRYDPSIYVVRGSVFLWDIASVAIHNGTVLAIFAVVALAVFWPLYRLCAPVVARVAEWIAKHGHVSRGGIVLALYATIFGLMALTFETYYYENLPHGGRGTGLLFDRNCGADRASPADGVRSADFGNVLLATFLVLALVPAAWRLTATMRHRTVLFAPFALVAVAFANLLLTIYGAVRFENTFYEIGIPPSVERGSEPVRLFIVNRTSDEFILWDPAGTELLWLPAQSVDTAHIGRGMGPREICRALRGASS